MARRKRGHMWGIPIHVLNRANGESVLFKEDRDYEAFERILENAVRRFPIDLLAHCLMPNHWHMVVIPREPTALSECFGRIAQIHSQRLHVDSETVGRGHIYQGRFKSFPVQNGWHLLSVLRYVERNALGASLVLRAEHWRWGSLWRRISGTDRSRALLSPWPIPIPKDWVEIVNEAQTKKELAKLRLSVARGRPYGQPAWANEIAERLGLQSSLREPGRRAKITEITGPVPEKGPALR